MKILLKSIWIFLALLAIACGDEEEETIGDHPTGSWLGTCKPDSDNSGDSKIESFTFTNESTIEYRVQLYDDSLDCSSLRKADLSIEGSYELVEAVPVDDFNQMAITFSTTNIILIDQETANNYAAVGLCGKTDWKINEKVNLDNLQAPCSDLKNDQSSILGTASGALYKVDSETFQLKDDNEVSTFSKQ